MSELTPCNYCTLEGIKRRNKGKKVKLRPAKKEDKYFLGGYDVYIDGEKSGAWFMEVSDRCVC